MREEIRELKELVAKGPEALVGRALLPEEWYLFSKLETVEGLGVCLPSVNVSGVRYPIEKVEVTGRGLHYPYCGAEARVRVRITFAETEGLTLGGPCLGWMEV